MGDGSLTENFEKCLLGLQAGDEKSFELAPEDAFGQPNPDNIYYVDRSKFGADTPAEVGTIIAFTQPDGTELPGLVRVAGDSVTIDFNHPLAGQRVTFEVEILGEKLMEILLANPRGFCAGVDRAISIVERALDIFTAPIYVRHEVVHNKYVVDGLKSWRSVC